MKSHIHPTVSHGSCRILAVTPPFEAFLSCRFAENVPVGVDSAVLSSILFTVSMKLGGGAAKTGTSISFGTNISKTQGKKSENSDPKSALYSIYSSLLRCITCSIFLEDNYERFNCYFHFIKFAVSR